MGSKPQALVGPLPLILHLPVISSSVGLILAQRTGRRSSRKVKALREEWISESCMLAKSLQFRSVAQSCPTLCDPMNRSTPGLPVHHHLPEFTQTHVHRVSDAIQPPHPLSSPSPSAPNPSQHQSLFQYSKLRLY